MAILTTNQLGLSFGALDLFSGISVSVPKDGRIGLVGPNGVGKTSLLLILAGLSEPTSGTVHRSRGSRIGYLLQEAEHAFAGQDRTIYDEMLSVFEDLRADEARLGEMEDDISRGAADDVLLARYGSLQEHYELSGGYEYEIRIRRVLTGLGFDRADHDLPLVHLSGGQKTRALLAQLLLDRPDLLILDEPTNHLDVEAVEWLENMLSDWPGAVLVVSHDRYFLDRAVNTIWEMRPTGIEAFRGNYSAYVLQRDDRWQRREKEFKAFKERMEKELDFIRRNMAGQRTQMAQGKLARASREVEAVRAGGLDVLRTIKSKGWMRATAHLKLERPASDANELARRIGEIQLPSAGPPRIKLALMPERRSGDIALRTSELEVGYPGKPLFRSDDIELTRLECAALMGGNGTGKTTFLRMLLGHIEPLAGECRLGGGLEIGYFAQAHDDLHADNTVLDEILQHKYMPTGEARGYLAQFLFHRDDVFKRVSALSGGERARLALAVLALRRANLLLLDEPTNHLDIPAQEVLQAVLEGFDGTVILVSHDRYLINRLATQIWELRNGRLHVFPGTYDQLLAERGGHAEGQEAAAGSSHDGAADGPLPDGVESETPKLSKNELRRRAERRERIEARIEQLEADRDELALHLQAASESGDVERIKRLSVAYEEARQESDALLAEWSELA